MITKIEEYNRLKLEQKKCILWADMLGKIYSGGGGGFGRLFSFKIARGQLLPTIYYQEYDSSNNYHTMPNCFCFYLEEEIKSKFNELLKGAMVRQEKALKDAANEALNEHKLLLKESGLEEK